MNEIDYREACGYLDQQQQQQEETMNINDEFPSNYLKASDLLGRTLKLIIDRVEHGDEKISNKPILHFQGKEKGLALNKTNAMTLAGTFGPETNTWSGQEVELFSQKVQFQNQMVDALRVRPILPALEGSDPNDDIPF